MSTATALSLDTELDLVSLWYELAAAPETTNWFEPTESGEIVRPPSLGRIISWSQVLL